MPSVAVVYYSGFGHTKVLAERVTQGAAQVPGVEAQMFSVDDLSPPDDKRQVSGPGWDALNDADAIIFGAPTYMGSVAAPFKQFMDHTSALWFRQAWRDKLAAGFTNSGGLSGDKVNAMQGLVVFAAQHSMMWVTLGIFPTRSKDPNDTQDLNRLGAWLGAMAQSDNASPEVTPPESDRMTAQLLGKRVADAAVRWRAGASAPASA